MEHNELDLSFEELEAVTADGWLDTAKIFDRATRPLWPKAGELPRPLWATTPDYR